MSEEIPTEHELKTYKGRVKCDSADLGAGYCGSCSIEMHIKQLNDPDSWVHSSIPYWLSSLKPAHSTCDRPDLADLRKQVEALNKWSKPWSCDMLIDRKEVLALIDQLGD